MNPLLATLAMLGIVFVAFMFVVALAIMWPIITDEGAKRLAPEASEDLREFWQWVAVNGASVEIRPTMGIWLALTETPREFHRSIRDNATPEAALAELAERVREAEHKL